MRSGKQVLQKAGTNSRSTVTWATLHPWQTMTASFHQDQGRMIMIRRITRKLWLLIKQQPSVQATIYLREQLTPSKSQISKISMSWTAMRNNHHPVRWMRMGNKSRLTCNIIHMSTTKSKKKAWKTQKRRWDMERWHRQRAAMMVLTCPLAMKHRYSHQEMTKRNPDKWMHLAQLSITKSTKRKHIIFKTAASTAGKHIWDSLRSERHQSIVGTTSSLSRRISINGFSRPDIMAFIKAFIQNSWKVLKIQIW